MFRHRIGEEHTEAHLCPDSALFQSTPGVRATGYLKGLFTLCAEDSADMIGGGHHRCALNRLGRFMPKVIAKARSTEALA